MATKREFCDAMIEVYKNHGVYIGTGNGEYTLDIAGKFFEMEKNYGRRDKDGNPLWYTDTARDYEYLAKCYRNKWDMTKSRAGDCSGIPVGVMRDLGIIPFTADYNCRTFIKKCTLVPLSELKAGDLVFNKKSDPSHMAVFDGEMVVESKGRDDGVVRRPVEAGNWATGGRLPKDWFDDEEVPELTRNLYYREGNLMKGEDVGMCQERLAYHKCDPGFIDGVFGKKTRDAVIKFQEQYNKEHSKDKLDVDGVVGQQTWTRLWEE